MKYYQHMQQLFWHYTVSTCLTQLISPYPTPLWQGMQWSAVKWQLKRFAKGFRFSDTSFRGDGGGRKKSRRGESKGRTKQAICHLGSLGAFLFTRFGFFFYFSCWGGVTWFATRMSRGWYVEKVKGSKKGGRGVERQGCSACSIVQNVSVSSLMFGCFCCCCVQHLSISFRDCHLELSFSISDFLFSFRLKCFAKLTLTACLLACLPARALCAPVVPLSNWNKSQTVATFHYTRCQCPLPSSSSPLIPSHCWAAWRVCHTPGLAFFVFSHFIHFAQKALLQLALYYTEGGKHTTPTI